MLANQHVWFGERVTGVHTRGNRSLLDHKMCCMRWQSTHQICLANYSCSMSSNHVLRMPTTQTCDTPHRLKPSSFCHSCVVGILSTCGVASTR